MGPAEADRVDGAGGADGVGGGAEALADTADGVDQVSGAISQSELAGGIRN
jgi:hypothetical protein